MVSGSNNGNGQSILDTYKAIERLERCTRSEIAADAGRSVVTVCKNIDTLLQNNLIIEEKDKSSTLGRKASTLRIHAEARTILILDITKRRFSSRLINLKNSDIAKKVKHEYDDGKPIADNLVDFFKTSKDQFWSDTQRRDCCIGVGVIVPGPYIDTADKIINNRLPELSTIPIKRLVESIFPDKAVLIEEDVKLAGLYSAALSGDKPAKLTFYAYIDEGVGGSIIKDGAIDFGSHSFAGDFGQMCLSSGRTVEQEISVASFRQRLGLPGAGAASTEELLSQIDYTNPRVLAVCQEIESFTALALYNVCWLVDPYYIIIESIYCTFIPNFVDHVVGQIESLLQQSRGGLQPQVLSSNSAVQYAYKGAASILLNRYLSLC